MNKLHKKGFTLVEIMVVVAIITIILAIAVPAITRMRQRADKEGCVANLRTISVAKKIWAIENVTGAPSWDDLVPDYIKRRPLCPIGGTYTIGGIGAEPTCSVDGHVYPPVE